MDNTPKQPSKEEYLACQLSSWYADFICPFPERKKGVTLKTQVLNVPDCFRPYLVEDGVRIPANTKPSSCLGCKPQRAPGDSDDDDSWSADSSYDEGSENVRQPLSHDLNKLTDEIKEAIKELGGSVLPKLNWSSPKDASWINEGTLKCQTAGDVYLLLKSSDFVSSDLELLDSVKGGQKIQLCLRKWANLFPSQEFRCFVKGKRLVCVSQRQADQHFEHLPSEKDELLVLLEDFMEDCVLGKFSSGQVPSYVVDVYIDRQDRVWIVDFNVWGERTDSLLFSWNELNSWESDKASEIRVVETEKEVRPHPLNNYRAPVDTVQIAQITGGNPDGFKKLMDLCQKPGTHVDNDERS